MLYRHNKHQQQLVLVNVGITLTTPMQRVHDMEGTALGKYYGYSVPAGYIGYIDGVPQLYPTEEEYNEAVAESDSE